MKESEIIDIYPIPVSEETPLLKDNNNNSKVQLIQKTCIHTNDNSESEAPFVITFLTVASLLLCFSLLVGYRPESVFSFELVCKSSFADKIHLHLNNITRRHHHHPNHILSATAIYLLQVPDQYFSSDTYVWSRSGFWRKWEKYYESLAIKATVEYVKMNEKDIANSTISDDKNENNVHFVVLKLLAATDDIYTIPTINKFEDVIKTLRLMKSIPSENVLGAELYWTHPLNDIRDVPSLNKIIVPTEA